jgi:hypothetical protein
MMGVSQLNAAQRIYCSVRVPRMHVPKVLAVSNGVDRSKKHIKIKMKEKNIFLVRVMFIMLSSTCLTPRPREGAGAVVAVHVSMHHALSYRARRRHNHASPVRLHTSHTATAGRWPHGGTAPRKKHRPLQSPCMVPPYPRGPNARKGVQARRALVAKTTVPRLYEAAELTV